jgi:hypothetical protein
VSAGGFVRLAAGWQSPFCRRHCLLPLLHAHPLFPSGSLSLPSLTNNPLPPPTQNPPHTLRRAGDIHRYDELCARHAARLNSQPALVEHERRLREKITILCLMELISSLPPHQRTIALGTVAERTKLPLDGVEFLLMKVGGVVVSGGVVRAGGCGGAGTHLQRSMYVCTGHPRALPAAPASCISAHTAWPHLPRARGTPIHPTNPCRCRCRRLRCT